MFQESLRIPSSPYPNFISPLSTIIFVFIQSNKEWLVFFPSSLQLFAEQVHVPRWNLCTSAYIFTTKGSRLHSVPSFWLQCHQIPIFQACFSTSPLQHFLWVPVPHPLHLLTRHAFGCHSHWQTSRQLTPSSFTSTNIQTTFRLGRFTSTRFDNGPAQNRFLVNYNISIAQWMYSTVSTPSNILHSPVSTQCSKSVTNSVQCSSCSIGEHTVFCWLSMK